MIRRISLPLALLLVTAVAGAAQTLPDVDPGSAEPTRADLERLMEQYEEIARTAASELDRSAARTNILRIQQRLEEGDFRLGDRILFSVRGEPDLPDTLTVEPGREVVLPVFGRIPLQGVLRSEIQAHLTTELGRMIRDPMVQARALMRVSVQGSVAQPGFYLVPSQTLVGEALMVAGGTLSTSKVEGIRIVRGPDIVAEGEYLQEAIRRGWTLDQLNLEPGDEIFVPARGRGWLATVGLISAIIGGFSFLITR